ncbi:MAG: hypothetical protein HFI17_12830 [Lachnospiraceae bacterium]|jgi:hypothetical protein|nr:hypothetical protein [Lachnospiraceae bacterium]MCI9601372.1 hypothetical protein [Lachnospiraceae bacterium]
MEKRFLTEVEERFIRQTSALDHYAVVKLQIYTIAAEKVIFENHCALEQLPAEFADSVEKCVFDYTAESGISGILVCLTDAKWRQYDSSEMDFKVATWKALLKVFSIENRD